MDEKAPKVFVSYAHESEDFRQKVGELAEFLRSKGIPVVTDHPYQNRAPEEGWLAWMHKNIKGSDVVLIVCTPRYKESFEKRDVERPAGYGSSWEAALITQELYESKLYNAKYIPILPDGGTHPDDVPAVLRDFCNNLRFPSQQERIWQAVLEKHSDPNADLPPFRRRPPGQLCADDNRLAPDQRDVFGREREIEQVLKFLNGSRPALHLTGTAGIGKTEICKRSLRIWLEQSPNAQAYWVNISDTATPEECAAAIARALGHDNIEKTDDLFSLLRPGLYYLDNLESLDSPAGNDLLRRLININNVRVVAALGEAKPLDRIMADWREKGTSIAQQANDPTRRGSLAVSLRLTADAVAARHSDALLLWSVAALFPDGLDEDVLYRPNPDASKPYDEALQLLVQYRVLTRRDERYHLLPPVACFALDEAQKEAGGFSWAAAKKVVLPLLLHLVRAADTTASTDEALIARAALLNNFSAVHRFVLQECQQAQPDAELMGYFAEGLYNWFSFNILLGKDILEKLLPVLKNASVHPVPYAGALLALGRLESRIGNVERARNLFNQAVELFRKEQHDLGRANALKGMGDLLFAEKRFVEALDVYRRALDLYQREQEPVGMAYTAANILRCLHASGNGQADEMRQLAEHSMTMALASGVPSVVGYVISCLVEVGVIDPNDLGQ
jgi:tetratricopeptide (TPR) repeat protein